MSIYGGRRRWELQELDPEWIDMSHGTWRYNVGFHFDCPWHGTHRLTIRFLNPYDGFEYVDGPGVLARMVENGSFGELTLEGPAGEDHITFPICGRLRIVEGKVELVLMVVP